MSGERRHLVVTADLVGMRADRVVATLAELPRTRVRRLIEAGLVTVAGEGVDPAQRLAVGTEVAVVVAEEDRRVVPEDVPFTVVFDDDHLLVVDKPAGVVVHPGAGTTSGTLVAGLLHRYPAQAELEDQRFGLVHRLDKDTSGLLVVARTADAHRRLQSRLRRREITRSYLALVAGTPPAATGTIDAPIGRHPTNATTMAVSKAGRPARTHYRRLAGWPVAALLEVTLESGRTHQIRVHLAAVDLPIVGDRTYGRRRAMAAPAGVSDPATAGRRHPADPGRQWLHATRLEFAHPATGQAVDVEAAVPEELSTALARLGPPLAGAVPRLAKPSPVQVV